MKKTNKIKIEKEIIYLIFTAVLFLFLVAFASAVDPGHSVSAIGPGTFPAGNYVFPSNLDVIGNSNITGTAYLNNASVQNSLKYKNSTGAEIWRTYVNDSQALITEYMG